MNTLQLQFLMLIFSGWVNRSQQDVIEYLQEENRLLREQLGGKRLLFTDDQRRRPAAPRSRSGSSPRLKTAVASRAGSLEPPSRPIELAPGFVDTPDRPASKPVPHPRVPATLGDHLKKRRLELGLLLAGE
jgi:hypothetical protein